MSTLTVVNFDVYRGERITIPFQVTPARNIAGETHKFTFAKKENFEEKLVGPSDLVIDDALTGLGHFTLTPSNTDLKPGTYYWDVWRTDTGSEICEAKGTITILAEVRTPPVT